MSASSVLVRRLSWFAVAFALLVIVFGAFVRLSNAGLSCPDWPTCYGKITWPKHEAEISTANEAFPERPVESHKAWREQVHRFLAGFLVLLTFTLAALSFRRRTQLGTESRVLLVTAAVIVFQALLGMWTVTWKLKPIVVMAHLVGGMLTFSLLAFVALRLTLGASGTDETAKLRRMVIVGIALVAIQIALGGWTSANYSALACGMDFPTCAGKWWPATDFREAFVLWRGIGVNYEGGVLDADARTAIQLVHRIGAVVVTGHLIGVIMVAFRRRLGAWGLALLAALAVQIVLGISNVKLGLPLPVATAHNGVAAVLLFVLLGMMVRLRRSA
ncbi:COX15/CtaA family protein [Tahibacter amnicola]|uniref:COX15/CtaA family protein n=1 Tax=Tahibacter amnicola TaxID=2976241 RepID=A0ABY6BFK6_9GAMM|nr:COX15/CtaA family protein [Tahibacter amnicola]UXI68654.1 COX15/CtaA family protein [Tahibacter amnicola]